MIVRHFFPLLITCTIAFLPTMAQSQDERITLNEVLVSARKLINSNLPAADSIASAALKTSLLLGIDSLTAKSLYTLGLTNYYASKFYISSNYYKKALETPYGSSHAAFASSCWNNLGINYEMTDQYAEAVKMYLTSLAYAEKIGDSLSVYQTEINLGLLYTKIKDYAAAAECLKKALGYFAAKNDLYNLALTRQNFGILCKARHAYGKAQENYSAALTLYEKLGDDQGRMQIINNQISLLLEIHEYDGIEALFASARKINATVNDDFFDATLRISQGTYYIVKREFGNAEASLLDAEKTFIALHAPEKLQQVYFTLTGLYGTTGNARKHAYVLGKYDSINTAIFTKETANRMAEFKTIYEDEKKAALIGSLRLELETKDRIITIWGLVFALTFMFIMALLGMYMDIRQKRKSLFDLNMEVSSAMTRELKTQHIPENPSPDSGDLYFLKIYTDLNERVIEKKLYLNPRLTVADLSKLLLTNDKYISKAISIGFGNNFSRYINTLRVNDVKLLLISPDTDRLAYDQIADKTGFNNAFTFQRQFKELTGLTPAAFKKANKK